MLNIANEVRINLVELKAHAIIYKLRGMHPCWKDVMKLIEYFWDFKLRIYFLPCKFFMVIFDDLGNRDCALEHKHHSFFGQRGLYVQWWLTYFILF